MRHKTKSADLAATRTSAKKVKQASKTQKHHTASESKTEMALYARLVQKLDGAQGGAKW